MPVHRQAGDPFGVKLRRKCWTREREVERNEEELEEMKGWDE